MQLPLKQVHSDGTNPPPHQQAINANRRHPNPSSEWQESSNTSVFNPQDQLMKPPNHQYLSPTLKTRSRWKVPRNHNKSDLESLRTTAKLNNITILPTDKTNRFCTLPTITCEEKLRQHLSNGWIQLPEDPSEAYQTASNSLIKTVLHESGIQNTYLQTRLISRHCRAPIIYPLGKDHKPSFPNTKVRVVQPIAGSSI